jgi:general secretion pathway protein C
MTTAALKSGSNSWTLRLFTLLIWLFVGLCAAYWAFKFVTTKPVEVTTPLAIPTVAIDSKAVAKLLGATDNVAAKPLNTTANTKFTLFGLAKTANGKGVALIALDGKPARPYRVGSLVADDLVLKSISKTGVLLAVSLSAPEGVTLELPQPKPTSMAVIAPRLPVSGAASPIANPVAAPTFTAPGAAQTQQAVIPPTIQNPRNLRNPQDGLNAQNSQNAATAAAAISRFAPRATSDGASASGIAAPAMPATATSSVMSESERP